VDVKALQKLDKQPCLPPTKLTLLRERLCSGRHFLLFSGVAPMDDRDDRRMH